MTKIFLVDDEPLVLIGMQGMLNWAELGYTVVGTARNGAEAWVEGDLAEGARVIVYPGAAVHDGVAVRVR